MDLLKIKCVAFDADNTLYQTKEAAKIADRAALQVLADKAGQSLEKINEEWQKIVQEIKASPDPKMRSRRYSYGKLSEKYPSTQAGAINSVEEMYQTLMDTLLKEIKIVPGVLDLIKTLKSKGVELVVITEDEDREKALGKLNALGLAEYFNQVITSSDVGTMKPSEKYYESILNKFKPEEILVVGDNYEKDLALPHELGMQTFLVDTPEKLSKLTLN